MYCMYENVKKQHTLCIMVSMKLDHFYKEGGVGTFIYMTCMFDSFVFMYMFFIYIFEAKGWAEKLAILIVHILTHLFRTVVTH